MERIELEQHLEAVEDCFQAISWVIQGNYFSYLFWLKWECKQNSGIREVYYYYFSPKLYCDLLGSVIFVSGNELHEMK